MVTAGTRGGTHFLDSPAKKDFFLGELFRGARQWGWSLQAWAVMANHYHFVAIAPENAESLQDFLRALHSISARWLNEQDNTPGRQVWFQYWDSCLTYRASYLARLHYVHRNPEKHGLVPDATAYPWCSMAWFAEGAGSSFRKTVTSFKIDRLNVPDDF